MSEARPRAGRFDILIVSSRPTFRVSDQGITSLMRWLVAAQIVEVRDHIVADDGTELALAPALFAHHAFAEGNAPPEPAMYEAVLRFGPTPAALTYGDPGRQVHFFLELVGVCYVAPSAEFLERLQQILYLRPEFFIRPHVPGTHTSDGRHERSDIDRGVGRRAAVTIVDK